MRILMVTESFDGGSGRHVVDLARELGLRGHEVVIAYSTLRANREFVAAASAATGVATVPFKMRRAVHPSDVLALLEVRRIHKNYGPFDVVHGHSSKGGAIARLLPGPRVYTAHAFRTIDPTISKPMKAFYAFAERALAKRTDALICGSSVERAHAEAMGYRAKRIETTPNGIPPERPLRRDALRARAGLAPGDVCIGFVGRFAPQKNPLRFVRAFQAVAARHPAARAVIVGGGEMSRDVHEAITAAGLASRATIIENEPGQPWMAAFDLFVMSSDYEAAPYVYLEALFAGLPIVTTEVGGAVEAVREGVNGHILALDDEAGLAACIAELVGDDARRAAFAAASLAHARNFHVDVMVDRVLGVYADVRRARKAKARVTAPRPAAGPRA